MVIIFDQPLTIVISMADEKERNNIVTEVGSASSWGSKERERFMIPEKATEVDVKALIGETWFQFQGLDDGQRTGLSQGIADCRI